MRNAIDWVFGVCRRHDTEGSVLTASVLWERESEQQAAREGGKLFLWTPISRGQEIPGQTSERICYQASVQLLRKRSGLPTKIVGGRPPPTGRGVGESGDIGRRKVWACKSHSLYLYFVEIRHASLKSALDLYSSWSLIWPTHSSCTLPHSLTEASDILRASYKVVCDPLLLTQ